MSLTDSSIDFPELLQSVLGPEELDALFRDIGTLTQVLEVIPKYGPRDYAPESASALTLDAARDLLSSGAVRGLQIRYIHEDAQWWDTLLRTPEGVRIVRIRHDPGQ